MAVKESLHLATDNYILPKPRKYYQALIYSTHWQLRSLIASPEQDVVYYPSGSDIIALNTKSKERETVAALDFAPRCLAASKDWICVGGEEGAYAAISLKEKRLLAELSTRLDFDADARLPLDLDLTPSHRASIRESMRRPRPPFSTVTPKVVKVGTEIVNCVTLWSPTPERDEKAYTIPVSVISNNDCTVTIMDLEKGEMLQQLDFPDFVNRSVMSPDGSLLATISDDPYLYIHERMRKSKNKRDLFKPISDADTECEWALLCRIQLEGQRASEKSDMRGSFAACFSGSGRYLAVATQHGTISVFDVDTVTEKDSLVAVFTTSRPSIDPNVGGAPRAMEFSPAPFDLLAWTESKGRVGIADVRTMFFSRQVVHIDSHAEDVEKVRILDKTHSDTTDQRILTPSNAAPSSTTPDYLGLDFDRRQLRHLTREMQDRHQSPITTEELEVLQAHRLARRQRDVANAAREALAEATTSSRWESTIVDASDPRAPAPATASASTLPAALQNFVNPDRAGTASFRNFINERNQDRERRGQNRPEVFPQVPMTEALRRLIANEGTTASNVARNTASRGTRNTVPDNTRDSNDAASLLDRLSLASRHRPPTMSSSSWAAIDALYRNRHTEESSPQRTISIAIDLESDSAMGLDFANRLRQPWGDPGDDSDLNYWTIPGLTPTQRTALRNAARPGGIVETMGLSWSENGRILYVGGANGIYEYHVNVTGRKMFPDLVLR